MCIQAGILSRSPTYIVNTMLKRKSHVHAGTEMLQGNCACAVLPVCTSRQDAPGSMQEQNILGVAEIYRPQVFNPPRAMHMLHTQTVTCQVGMQLQLQLTCPGAVAWPGISMGLV